jgi:hypothetical protein
MNKSQASRHSTHPKREGLALKRFGAGAVILAAIGISLANLEKETNKIIERQRSEAVKNINQVEQHVLVLKSGAKLRSWPESRSGNGTDDDLNNQIGEVPEGKEYVVMEPAAYSEKPGWVALTIPGTDIAAIHNLKERIDSTVWAAESELVAQGVAAVASFEGASVDSVAGAKVNPDGSLTVNGSLSPTVAASVELEAGTYDKLHQEGLIK